MTTQVITISIGKKYKPFMDELIVCATGNGKSVASEVCRSVKYYMERFKTDPMLASDEKWEDFLENATKDEILEINTLICDKSVKLISKWKSLE